MNEEGRDVVRAKKEVPREEIGWAWKRCVRVEMSDCGSTNRQRG